MPVRDKRAIKAAAMREDPFTMAVVDMLRVCLGDDVLWTHHPNNFMPINHRDQDQVRRQRIHSLRMHKMGLRKGWADFDFVWDGRFFCIELKTGSSLSKEQRDFRDDCLRLNIPWAVCKTLDSVWQTLHDWGIPIRRISF